MSATADSKIDRADLSEEELTHLYRLIDEGKSTTLVGDSGEPIELPKAIREFMLDLLEAMRRDQTVFLVQENEALTTQAAANYLGVSRQFLVQLLEKGDIPFHRAGTHRRILFKDLVEYQKIRSAKRRAKLNAMTEELVEAGLYDRFAPLGRDEK